MLPYIMFNSTPGSGPRFFLTRKEYRAPVIEIKKEKQRRRILAFGPNINKSEKMWKMPGVGYYDIRHCPPKYV